MLDHQFDGLVAGIVIFSVVVLLILGMIALYAWEAWLQHQRELRRMEDNYWQRRFEEEEE